MESKWVLARHGETAANAAGLWQGAEDEGLTARGIRQAQALARRLASEYPTATAIYSSPLYRARQTAEIIQAALPYLSLHLHPGLVEYNLGDWVGLSPAVLRNEYHLWEKMAADPDFAPPGGESPRHFAQRILVALQEIDRAHIGSTIIIVSHSGVIATALALFLHGDGSRWTDYDLANGAFSVLAMGEQPRLLCHNETGHLVHIGSTMWTMQDNK
ncbi:MAG: histidine phosphatase family protein [Anaerolineae bacterium]|jgi:broad specificity phosphatase PhoE|nr:histidine phosphatase family protein [Anaerolineae bacterium]MDH7474245.1 histidine phosphatase family protein [Anaerolineae bacterium]